ncbi:CoA pyrophosphatase [Saccharopolyspora rhizosphaerae]|uniref:CoA pyrophosphatase n=1 Tax=Saccharopolyspora rhizosphaerae TaxID=2492662 RepID=A0A426JQ05_9PSEU|nr:CoA pyrophosphatase [Saccharopolyspora rhizosphaerae]RRO15191.1 CoA pyrophosphatase [Saccharopolyspora rhizosphaerae]
MRTLVKRTADLDPGHFGWPKGSPPRSARPAAVLILLGEDEHGPDVLLLRRAEGLDKHPGQVAFPGGSLDDEDRGPVDAALREAVEEVGVQPEGIRPVATLPELHVPHSGFRVTPVLAHWREPSPVAPVDPGETAAVARVPISWLSDPENRMRVRLTSGFAGPAFLVPGMLVWGFTGGLLAGLLELAGWARHWDRSDVRGLDEAWRAAEEADDVGFGRS